MIRCRCPSRIEGGAVVTEHVHGVCGTVPAMPTCRHRFPAGTDPLDPMRRPWCRLGADHAGDHVPGTRTTRGRLPAPTEAIPVRAPEWVMERYRDLPAPVQAEAREAASSAFVAVVLSDEKPEK